MSKARPARAKIDGPGAPGRVENARVEDDGTSFGAAILVQVGTPSSDLGTNRRATPRSGDRYAHQTPVDVYAVHVRAVSGYV